jgi:hypothetical protein
MDIESIRDQFDLPRLKAFNTYTEQYPPQHILIAAYFGYGTKKKEVEQLDGNELVELMAAFPEVKR